MSKISYITAGECETIDATPGESVMMTAVQNGVDGIIAECGGSLSCATCHVFVDDNWIAKTGTAVDDEAEMLEGAMTPATANSRLSCQIEVTDDLDGLIVHIPDEQ